MDDLSYLRGRGEKISDDIILKHPTLGEIEEWDYMNAEDFSYDNMVSLLLLNPLDVADILWIDNHIWYEDIKDDWSFFIQMALSECEVHTVKYRIEEEVLNTDGLFLGKRHTKALNFFLQTEGEYFMMTKAIPDSDKQQIILVNVKQYDGSIDDCIKFTEVHYIKLVSFLKKINWVSREYDVLKGGSRQAKEYILKHQRKKRNKKTVESINRSSIFSAITARNGVGSDVKVFDLPIYRFYDIYFRLNKIDSYNQTMTAYYSGNIDTSKSPLNMDKINWSAIITTDKGGL